MSKITFSSSFTDTLPIGGSAGRGCDNMGQVIQKDIMCLFVNYKIGDDTVCVIIPSAIWCEVIITVNGLTVDLNKEYPNVLNQIRRKAHKLFPHWQG